MRRNDYTVGYTVVPEGFINRILSVFGLALVRQYVCVQGSPAERRGQLKLVKLSELFNKGGF